MYLVIDLEGCESYITDILTVEEIQYSEQGSTSIIDITTPCNTCELSNSKWVSIKTIDHKQKVQNFGSATYPESK